MREKFITYVINKFTAYYGYGVIEIDNFNRAATRWALVKSIDINTKRVIIFIDENSNVENFEAVSALKFSLGCESIELIKLLLLDNEDSNYNPNITEKILNEADVIAVNYKEGRILAYGSQTDGVTYELARIFEYDKTNEQENRKPKDKPYATLALISVNIIMYLITAILSGNIFDSDINVLILLGAKYNEFISAGQYYRLITCMFLHGGIIHLAFNMYALYSIGRLVERVYGKAKYLVIYFISGIISSVFSFIFSNGVSIGASGAIFGLLGTTLVFAVTMRKNIGKGFLRNITSVIIINLFIGFTMSNIDNFGHLGGLLGGSISALVFNLIKKSER